MYRLKLSFNSRTPIAAMSVLWPHVASKQERLLSAQCGPSEGIVRAEVRGSFMWSPKRNANGARNQFYENVREVAPGDVVFSFCDTRIKAIGVVTGGSQTGPKPDFGNAVELVERRLVPAGRLLHPEQPDPTQGPCGDPAPLPARQVLAAAGEWRR